MDIAIAMREFSPNILFECPDNTYDNLVILDGSDKPTLAQLEGAWHEWQDKEAIRLAAEAHVAFVAQLRREAVLQLESKAEKERLRYITPGAGKAMAYQQQKRELDLWLSGERREYLFPIARKIMIVTNQSLQQVINDWYNNISMWLEIGSTIEANLVRIKRQLAGLQADNEADFEAFMATVNFYEAIDV